MCPRDDKEARSSAAKKLPGTLIRKSPGAGSGGGESPTVLIPEDQPDLFRFLESRGLISSQQTDDLKRDIVLGTESLAERLVENGLAAKGVATALGDYFGIDRAARPRLESDPALLSKIPPSLWRKAFALPVGRAKGQVLVVTSDPSLTILHEELERAIGASLAWSVVPVPTLHEALARALGPKLVIRRQDGSKRSEHVLRGEEVFIGKNPDNQVVLDDPTVSRRHARLEKDSHGRWTLHDQGSANGTFVDGRKIRQKIAMASGARIRVGETDLVFFDAGDKDEGLATDQVGQSTPLQTKHEEAKTAALPAQGKSHSVPTPPEPAHPPKSAKAPKKSASKKKSKKSKKADSRMKAAWVRVAGQFVATLAAVVTPLILFQLINSNRGSADRKESPKNQLFRETFPQAFEPSGVLQFQNSGKIYFVDDSRPGSLFRFELDSRGRIRGNEVEELPFSSPAPASDLEALTIDPASGAIYALSSHALDHKGREVDSALLRFEMGDSGLELVESLPNLRELLISRYPLLQTAADLPPQKKGLNLEAIAWDASKNRLLIGARSPLESTYQGDAAMVFSMEATAGRARFELHSASFAADPIFLNLEGAGLRGMEFDPESGRFLLLSGGATKAGRFRIWEWDGEEASTPLEIRGVSFERGHKPEGITRVELANGKSVILMVDDSGGYFVFSDKPAR